MSARHIVIGGGAIVGVATFAVSSVSLYALAVECGIPEPLAAGLPIALDVGAIVGALAWITERDERRKWGRVLAVGALALSLAGNGLAHAIAIDLVRVSLPLVLAVGASIPLVLFGVIHLAALMAKEPAVAMKSKPAPKKQKAAPSPGSTPAAEPAAADPTEKADEQPTVGKRAAGLEFARENWPVTGGAIKLAVGCSKGEADRIRAMVKQEKELSA